MGEPSVVIRFRVFHEINQRFWGSHHRASPFGIELWKHLVAWESEFSASQSCHPIQYGKTCLTTYYPIKVIKVQRFLVHPEMGSSPTISMDQAKGEVCRKAWIDAPKLGAT